MVLKCLHGPAISAPNFGSQFWILVEARFFPKLNCVHCTSPSCSPFHRPDMTETVVEKDAPNHPFIHHCTILEVWTQSVTCKVSDARGGPMHSYFNEYEKIKSMFYIYTILHSFYSLFVELKCTSYKPHVRCKENFLINLFDYYV